MNLVYSVLTDQTLKDYTACQNSIYYVNKKARHVKNDRQV